MQFSICKLPVRTSYIPPVLSFPNPAGADLNAGAHYHTVDFRPSRTSNLHISKTGSIPHFSNDTGAIIGRLPTAIAEDLIDVGSFTEAWDYFAAVAEAKFGRAWKNNVADDDNSSFNRLSPFVLKDMVNNTTILKTGGGAFHLDHMDMGTQNILVDQRFNFLAIIDWELAQTAPWEVIHYPMPFPLVLADAKTNCILQNPDHITHRNVSRQFTARRIYRQKFRDAERALEIRGRSSRKSISDVLDAAASRLYAIVKRFVFIAKRERNISMRWKPK